MSTAQRIQGLSELRMRLQRDRRTKTELRVGMGTCSIAVGAREVVQAVLAEIDKQELDVNVTTTGCEGFCSEEPLLTVERPGEPAITYCHMTPERVARIIQTHVIEGHPVLQWTLVSGDDLRNKEVEVLLVTR